MKLPSLALAALLALPLYACSDGSASLSDREFGRKVRAYLLEHPEVLQEMSDKLQEKQAARQMANFRKALAQHRDAVERDPRDFVANPGGRITVTEFYDYNCGYCKTISPEVVKLIRENPDIRFVFKEYQIFQEPSSLRGARAALLAKGSGRYVQIHQAMMAEKPLEPARIDAILRKNGVDPTPLDNPAAMAAIDRQLSDVQGLATALGIEGTPAFVIGDTLVPGADMAAVRAAIADARRRG